MAMTASKGPDRESEELGVGFERSVLEPPRRSPAPREEAVEPWTWEAE
jgi:hypothetical protein